MKKDKRTEARWPATRNWSRPNTKRTPAGVSPKEDRRVELSFPSNPSLEEILAPGWAWRMLSKG